MLEIHAPGDVKIAVQAVPVTLIETLSVEAAGFQPTLVETSTCNNGWAYEVEGQRDD